MHDHIARNHVYREGSLRRRWVHEPFLLKKKRALLHDLVVSGPVTRVLSHKLRLEDPTGLEAIIRAGNIKNTTFHEVHCFQLLAVLGTVCKRQMVFGEKDLKDRVKAAFGPTAPPSLMLHFDIYYFFNQRFWPIWTEMNLYYDAFVPSGRFAPHGLFGSLAKYPVDYRPLVIAVLKACLSCPDHQVDEMQCKPFNNTDVERLMPLGSKSADGLQVNQFLTSLRATYAPLMAALPENPATILQGQFDTYAVNKLAFAKKKDKSTEMKAVDEVLFQAAHAAATKFGKLTMLPRGRKLPPVVPEVGTQDDHAAGRMFDFDADGTATLAQMLGDRGYRTGVPLSLRVTLGGKPAGAIGLLRSMTAVSASEMAFVLNFHQANGVEETSTTNIQFQHDANFELALLDVSKIWLFAEKPETNICWENYGLCLDTEKSLDDAIMLLKVAASSLRRLYPFQPQYCTVPVVPSGGVFAALDLFPGRDFVLVPDVSCIIAFQDGKPVNLSRIALKLHLGLSQALPPPAPLTAALPTGGKGCRPVAKGSGKVQQAVVVPPAPLLSPAVVLPPAALPPPSKKKTSENETLGSGSASTGSASTGSASTGSAATGAAESSKLVYVMRAAPRRSEKKNPVTGAVVVEGYINMFFAVGLTDDVEKCNMRIREELVTVNVGAIQYKICIPCMELTKTVDKGKQLLCLLDETYFAKPPVHKREKFDRGVRLPESKKLKKE
jgi:hypothetical protein